MKKIIRLTFKIIFNLLLIPFFIVYPVVALILWAEDDKATYVETFKEHLKYLIFSINE